MSPSAASAPPTRSTGACRRRRSCARGSASRGASPPSAPLGGSWCRSSCNRPSTRASSATDGVDLGLVAVLAVDRRRRAVRSPSLAQRTAVVRLGRRSEQALYLLRARLIAHIHRLSLADHNEERRGALVARVTSDIETLAQFFQWGGLAWLLDGPLMLMVAAVMLAYDWILALVAFAVAAPLALVLRAVQRHLVEAYDDARERNGEMLAAVTEVVTGSPTTSAPTTPARRSAQAADDVDRAAHAGRRSGPSVIGAFLFPSGEVFSVLTVAAVIVVGVVRGPDSGLTAGAMIGFIFLTYRFLEPIAEFTEVLDQTQTAVAGLRRVLGVLDLPVGPPPPHRPRAAARRPARHRRPRRDVLVPDAWRHRRGRRRRAAPRQRAHPGRPAGRHGRRHRFGQDDARAADRPLRRPDDRPDPPRRRAAARRRQRRAAPAPRRRVPGAVPVRRLDRRQRRLRPTRDVAADDMDAVVARLDVGDWVDSAARRPDDRGRRARRAAVGG